LNQTTVEIVITIHTSPMHDYISGIQQIGIGVKDASKCLHEYSTLFGMDALVFDDVSEASLMTRYTGGQVYKRRAFLSLNLKGGGGFEIWQFQNRTPAESIKKPEYGDLGIYAAKLKCSNINEAYGQFSHVEGLQISSLKRDEKGDDHFWVKDNNDNLFNVVTGNHWFQKSTKVVGGVTGAVIGVSDMDKAIAFYASLLNIDDVIYDYTGVADSGAENEKRTYRKVLLQKHPSVKGAFGKLLGSIEIELVQCLHRTPVKIYGNRFWGDCGFIHLCFDVFDMCALKKHAEQQGYKFTVDSINSFEMDNASGRFCYMEDPDGTLIELVETHKVPVFKKLGLYLNLKKRNLEKPLPDWMIKMLALSKVK
jgi:catechol 2,3-dioxygenase-like lactoylglutathione lyase family enzyme